MKSSIPFDVDGLVIAFMPAFIMTLLVLFVALVFTHVLYPGNRFMLQLAWTIAFAVFWVGVFWATDLTAEAAMEKLSHPAPLIDVNNQLHPFMKVGSYYRIINSDILCTEGGERIYVLRGKNGDEDGKIFCVQTAHDYVLPERNFQVVKKTEDRGEGSPKTSFVFE